MIPLELPRAQHWNATPCRSTLFGPRAAKPVPSDRNSTRPGPSASPEDKTVSQTKQVRGTSSSPSCFAAFLSGWENLVTQLWQRTCPHACAIMGLDELESSFIQDGQMRRAPCVLEVEVEEEDGSGPSSSWNLMAWSDLRAK